MTSTATVSTAAADSTPNNSTTSLPTAAATSVADIKAKIIADFESGDAKAWDVVFNPSLVNLDSKISEFAVSGSGVFEQYLKQVKELVAVGDVIAPNTPDIRLSTVEEVDLNQPGTPGHARITICEVSNFRRITLPEHSPTSSEVLVAGTGELAADRTHYIVALDGATWKLESHDKSDNGVWKGQDHCDPTNS